MRSPGLAALAGKDSLGTNITFECDKDTRGWKMTFPTDPTVLQDHMIDVADSSGNGDPQINWPQSDDICMMGWRFRGLCFRTRLRHRIHSF